MALKPLPCCVAYALAAGKEPSMGLLCEPCKNYRSFMEYMRYPEEKTYGSFESNGG